ncbi:MAG: hypothetical protein KAQ69_03535 [Spirochaetales bacterium]|nr:hypothetical protein [Spirochaetales bacterium]
MLRIKKIFITTITLMFFLSISFLSAESPPDADSSDPDERVSGYGVSVISPGLPIALKAVYQKGEWGVQFEFNYFYMLGMLRIDGRRILMDNGWNDVYGFAGITGMHFNDGLMQSNSINNTLFADFGIGGELRLGRERQFGIGLEGGLLVPFYSNQGLEQYDNSGLLVANVFLLFWL